MAEIIKYWRDGTLRNDPNGIAIVAQQDTWRDYLDPDVGGNLQDMYNFAAFTADCLNYLAHTAMGRTVITILANQAVRIYYHPGHNMVRTGNAAASLNLVANEVIYRGGPGPITRSSVRRMNMFKFIDEFRKQPKWDIEANPSATVQGNLGIDDNGLRAWIEEGMVPSGFDQTRMNQLKLTTISTLDRYSPRGHGSTSDIGFCISKTNEDNRQRPPAIALAHELIHAYYSFMGCQCGREMDYTLPLFEFKCVGLGRPWTAALISENAVRIQWAGVAVPAEDVLNCRRVGRRPQYD